MRGGHPGGPGGGMGGHHGGPSPMGHGGGQPAPPPPHRASWRHSMFGWHHRPGCGCGGCLAPMVVMVVLLGALFLL